LGIKNYLYNEFRRKKWRSIPIRGIREISVGHANSRYNIQKVFRRRTRNGNRPGETLMGVKKAPTSRRRMGGRIQGGGVRGGGTRQIVQ